MFLCFLVYGKSKIILYLNYDQVQFVNVSYWDVMHYINVYIIDCINKNSNLNCKYLFLSYLMIEIWNNFGIVGTHNDINAAELHTCKDSTNCVVSDINTLERVYNFSEICLSMLRKPDREHLG